MQTYILCARRRTHGTYPADSSRGEHPVPWVDQFPSTRREPLFAVSQQRARAPAARLPCLRPLDPSRRVRAAMRLRAVPSAKVSG
eukprot:1454309-Prymnesium_polylepis.2